MFANVDSGKASMSSMSDIGHLSVVNPFRMRTIVNFLDGMSMIRWMREKSIIFYLNAIHCGGRRVRILKVKLLWRVDPGMDLIPGSGWLWS